MINGHPPEHQIDELLSRVRDLTDCILEVGEYVFDVECMYFESATCSIRPHNIYNNLQSQPNQKDPAGAYHLGICYLVT